jgi:hypothetical protein
MTHRPSRAKRGRRYCQPAKGSAGISRGGVRWLVLALTVAVAGTPGLLAQGRGGPPVPATPRAAALIDLTGYWVSVVTEDWRWRMVTPPKGDYASVPMTREARMVADTWDVSKDGSCLAYGAAGLLRIPTRLRFSWTSDTVLNLETDAGTQTRRLVFDRTQSAGPRSLQGFSLAEWEPAGGRGAPAGDLKVVTTNMTGGWVRKNGVPYSANAVLTEYFDRFYGPNGEEWINVTTIVEDPKYFTLPFVTTTHFKKEPDGSKWSPSRCREIE